MTISIHEVKDAYQRIKSYIHRTPILTSQILNELSGATLYFKCENFQKVGAFKYRGACNAVFSLSDAIATHGVATHSSGNHAAALALAAKTRGINAYIVMPDNSARVKKEAVAYYGGQITFCEPTLEARIATLEEIIKKTHATLIHPYNDYKIMAGQGTAALELVNDINDLDIVIAPIGGGGLISGTAIAVTALSPHTKVIGAEPELANDAYLSLRAQKLMPVSNKKTICDGLRVSLGDLTFPIIQANVSDIILASEASIINAMRLVWERMKIIIEPSSAVALAIVLENKHVFANKKVGIILSGGNVDIKEMAQYF